MNGLDNIYSQQFSQITNTTGLVSLANVFFSEYAVVASKNNYHTLLDTIIVSKNNHSFNLELSAITPGSITENSAPFFNIYPIQMKEFSLWSCRMQFKHQGSGWKSMI